MDTYGKKRRKEMTTNGTDKRSRGDARREALSAIIQDATRGAGMGHLGVGHGVLVGYNVSVFVASGELPAEISEDLVARDIAELLQGADDFARGGVDDFGFEVGRLSPVAHEHIVNRDALDDVADAGEVRRGSVEYARRARRDQIQTLPECLVLCMREFAVYAKLRVEVAIADAQDGVQLGVHRGIGDARLAQPRVLGQLFAAIAPSRVLGIRGVVVERDQRCPEWADGTVGLIGRSSRAELDQECIHNPVLHAFLGHGAIAFGTEFGGIKALKIVSALDNIAHVAVSRVRFVEVHEGLGVADGGRDGTHCGKHRDDRNK